MRDVVKKLIKEYYDTDIIVREMVVQQQQGRQVINIFPNLAAVKWNLFVKGTVDRQTGIGDPDVDRTNQILEARRQQKAEQVFAMVQYILKIQEETENFNTDIWKNTVPKPNDYHPSLIQYSQRALFYLKILTPFEYDTTEDQIDESGIEIATKLLPKQVDKENLEGFGEE